MEKYYEKELLEELHDIQETYGFISEEDILRVSEKGISPKPIYMESLVFILCFI